MKYEFKKVIDGIAAYMDNEIYSGMNDWQRFAARVMVGRIINNQEAVKNMLINNGFIRTFGIVDSEGMVDVWGILKDVRKELEAQERVSFTIPIFGKYTFLPSDVDNLYKTITGEELRVNETN